MSDDTRQKSRSLRNAILLVADEHFFPPAAFLAEHLGSLNARPDTDILIFTDSQASITALADSGVPARAHLVPRDWTKRRLPESGHITRAAYYRYLAAEMLAGEYSRLLYLDVDIYPEDERVFRLLDLDLGGSAIGAVRDLPMAFSTYVNLVAECRATLRKGRRKYLNAGVLLIDTRKYAKADIAARLMKIVSDGKVPLHFHDQTALNILLDGDWAELSPACNMLSSFRATAVSDVFPPALLHFSGPVKPWHGAQFVLDHRARAEFERFIAASPWKGFTRPFQNFGAAWAVKDADKRLPHQTQSVDWTFFDRRRLRAYLRETDFLDVRQGFAEAKLDLLPANF